MSDMKELRDKTAIVGVGYSEKQGTVPNKTVMSLALEACKNAIEDAGLKKDDIDGLLLQPTMGQTHSYNVAANLGIHLGFTANEDVMGASGGCIAQHAACRWLQVRPNTCCVSMPPLRNLPGRSRGAAGAPAESRLLAYSGPPCSMPWLPGAECMNSAQVRIPGAISL